MKILPFSLPYLVPLSMIASYLCGYWWTLQAMAWIPLIVAVLDMFVGLDTLNPTNVEAENLSHIAASRLVLYLWLPVQTALIVCGLLMVTEESLTMTDRVYLIVSAGMVIGMTNGTFGVAVAHELMHRPGWFEQRLAELLMAMVSYTHFCIEHVHGHHNNVGMTKDPATARFGESFYTFYPRTVLGGLMSAWKLEVARLRRFGVHIASFHNRMLRYFVTLIVTYAVIGQVFGWLGVTFFAVQSVVGFSILELINYVEHYGLTRREIVPGRYERVTHRHAWNSNHRISNWLLFNVGRHSDHHHQAGRCYPALRHADDAPQLPASYFAMFALALLPPLWRHVMDPQVVAWRRKNEETIK